MRKRVTYLTAGMTVGLLGGSFDPPHAGHVHITREALKRFGLDRVWWLVSPGNPLKSRGPAAMADRLAAARAIMRHPKVTISDFEARSGTRYTAETLRALQARYPGVRFVWLMGADNLAQFHRWKDWEYIMENVHVGVLARPGDRIAAKTAKAAAVYDFAKVAGKQSRRLIHAPKPAWCFVNVPMVDISSTEIRAKGDWASR
jgi:nicotinate-nucleotide adenylyltransferase